MQTEGMGRLPSLKLRGIAKVHFDAHKRGDNQNGQDRLSGKLCIFGLAPFLLVGFPFSFPKTEKPNFSARLARPLRLSDVKLGAPPLRRKGAGFPLVEWRPSIPSPPVP